MVVKPQTPKEPLKETPAGAGTKGKSVTPPAGVALSPEEQAELEAFRKIKKETGFTKFSESATEAIRLAKENATLKEKLEQSSATLSEDDLKQMNPDYETMSDEEKKDFREKMAMKRRMAVLEAKEKMRQDYASIPEGLRKKIEAKGGYDAFRDYACSPENAGQKSILNLAKSFLYEEKEEITPEPPEVRPGLEEPGIGKEITPPSGFIEMTAEQVGEMRTAHPKEYAELAKSKKLKIVG
jgi:uncharacterized membrane-anchored protein YhcB (DUF1043 family)